MPNYDTYTKFVNAMKTMMEKTNFKYI